ncbi:hypothetical protein M0R04_14285 [Candidatus Dojkabacteria bacterium]|jgi:hypothetical protein|nr:hypothetical protein [Candidatus Dojkabacteria bacterium]
MKKTKKLVPLQNKQIMEAISNGLKLSFEQEQTLRANLPAWVPDKENLGTAMQQAGMEYSILIEDILKREFGFSEKELIRLEKKIKKVLPVLHTMEIKRGLSILSRKDMAMVGDIAEKRYERLDDVDKHYFLGKKQKLLK